MKQKSKEKIPKGPHENPDMAHNRSKGRFVMSYLVCMGAFFVLKEVEFFRNIIDINGLYTDGIVWFTSKFMAVLGVPCSSVGPIIHLPSISLEIRFGCNGLEAVFIYSAAILVFPGPWQKKLLGLLGGFVILQTINILRIVALAYSGVYYKALFHVLHIYIAPGIMIIAALLTFLYYLNYDWRKNKEAPL